MSRYNDKYSNFQKIKKYIKSKYPKTKEDKEILNLKYTDITDIDFNKNSSSITVTIKTRLIDYRHSLTKDVTFVFYKNYRIYIDEDEFMSL